MMASGILVWSERPDLAAELLGKARRLADAAGGEVSICTIDAAGPAETAAFAAQGADAVYATDASPSDAARYADLVTEASRRAEPRVVLIGATKTGLEVAPRVAERTGAAYAPWIVELEIEQAGGGVAATCMVYAGAGLADYRYASSVTVASAAPGVFEAQDLQGRAARLEPLALSVATTRVAVLGDRPKTTGGERIEEARAVVDIGRGVKERADLEMIQTLAGLLNGQVACSRPVSSDRDWLPEWLGLSGAKIKPELCLTVGISGAVQHVIGIRDSRVVAAVNNDEDAAIFTQADIGVVADLYEFLPILIDRLRERGVRPTWE
jgi:electron transfer flavoprotein alpha subunit